MKGVILAVYLLMISQLCMAASRTEFEEGLRGVIIDSNLQNNVPHYELGTLLNIAESYYDYFYTGHKSFSLIKQPSPAGNFDGGGLYQIFHSTIEAGELNRVYYAHILNGVVTSSGLMNPDAPLNTTEIFPTAAIDNDTGNPFFIWTGQQDDRHTLFCYNNYSATGLPGEFNAPYGVFDKFNFATAIKFGDSPLIGMKRVYIIGSIENVKYLAFTDFFDIEDLSVYNSEAWTIYEIPYTKDWDEQGFRSYDDFVLTDDGTIAIVGTLTGLESINDDKLFVLANDSYGDGCDIEDWSLYETPSALQIANPDGYFHGTTVSRSLSIEPYTPRFTADVNEKGEVLMPMIYQLFIPDGVNKLIAKDFTFVKLVKFNFNTEEFIVSDIYPRSENPAAFLFLPWDPDGDGTWEYTHVDEDSFLVVERSFPVWWWDQEDYYQENYVRITQIGKYLAIVFQESLKARFFHEYNIPEYEGQVGEIVIVISDDYGQSWFDPIVLNPHPDDINYQPALDGTIPAYVCVADKIDILNEESIRLHLSFFDHRDYGSSVHGNSPVTGGSITYLPIDIFFGEVSVEEAVLTAKVQELKSNYPNPFNPSTTISFTMPNDDNINLSIYNVRGQLVKTLVDNNLQKGEHSVIWNGRDGNNRQLGSGVYFYRLQTSQRVDTRKMLLVK